MDQEVYKQWIAGIFDRSASKYGEGNNHFFDYFAKELVKFANLSQGAAVLDIATGRGAILKEALNAIGPKGKIVGIDISSNMIEETKRRYNFPNVDLLCMDAENLEFDNESFDYVFCGFALFFFPDLQKALKEIHRVLKPSGKLFISTWGEGTIQDTAFDEIYKKFELNVKTLKHDLSNVNEIEKILSAASFKELQIVTRELDHVYPTFEDWFISLWDHAGRAKLEKCSLKQLMELQKDLKVILEPHLKSDGLHEILRVNFAAATKGG